MVIKISLVDEMQWRLDKLEESDKELKKIIEKLESDINVSIEKIYDKLDKNNTMLITSLISSLLTLIIIIFMFVSNK